MSARLNTSLSPSRRPPGLVPPGPSRPAFLSEADCRELLARLVRVAEGGGYTRVKLYSRWMGHVRWARNHISSAGDGRRHYVEVLRSPRGAGLALSGCIVINEISDAALVAAARRAERLARLEPERPLSDVAAHFQPEALEHGLPPLFSDATYHLDAAQRTAAAQQLMQAAQAAGMHAAGYLEVSAHSIAQLDTYGRVWYYPYTQAQYSTTVRDPKGLGSGWAGLDHYDWTQIDAPTLSQTALDKCLKSRNPVKIEPGRYTAVLEPQAVSDFVRPLIHHGFGGSALDRQAAENSPGSPFFKALADPVTHTRERSKLGEQVIDTRLSLSADPRDPALGFPPFDVFSGEYEGFPWLNDVYHPAVWIQDGVLVNLAYNRRYGAGLLGQDTGLPDAGALRMSVTGPTASLAEMIASTSRGLLVTRFDQIAEPLSERSQLYRGQTRDGLWLIEHGQVTKPVHNLVFTESILFALNNVEQIGVPRRVFHPPVPMQFPLLPTPMIVPALKIRDFSFTAIDDAV